MELQFITLTLLLTLKEMYALPANTRLTNTNEVADVKKDSGLILDKQLIDTNKLKDSIIIHHLKDDLNKGDMDGVKENDLKSKNEKVADKLTFITKSVKDVGLSLDQLKPVDHIDAVKMEQDGHINKEYHKELFLGNVEVNDKETDEDSLKKLNDVFDKVDVNNDNHLSEAEMEGWIIQKMEEHFAESFQENDEIFAHLNKDPNGTVPWKVYYTHFLLAKGYPIKQVEKQVIDYDEIDLNSEDKMELAQYKMRWTDADVDPIDNALSKSEFLAFRHPEQSIKTVHSMVTSILNNLDKNSDRNLTEEEFVAFPPGDVEGEEFQEMDRQWQRDRIREFREALDKNGDGIATVEELQEYIDPRNPVQALMESRSLISMMDDDKDEELSRDEVINHRDIFLTSKVVDLVGTFHDEF